MESTIDEQESGEHNAPGRSKKLRKSDLPQPQWTAEMTQTAPETRYHFVDMVMTPNGNSAGLSRA